MGMKLNIAKPDKKASNEVNNKAATTTVSKLSTEKVKIVDQRDISRSKLVFDADNRDATKNIESLANSILINGLVHLIAVRYDEDNDVFVVTSGERRTRALDMLVEQYKNIKEDDPLYPYYERNVKPFAAGKYPCVVKEIEAEKMNEGDPDDAETLREKLRLYAANLEVEGLTNAEMREAVLKMAEIKRTLNIGIKTNADKINVAKEIAEVMPIGERQVKRILETESLEPELVKHLEEDNISMAKAREYAKKSSEEQKQIAEEITEKRNLETVDSAKKMTEKEILAQREDNLIKAIDGFRKKIEKLKKADPNLVASYVNEVKSILNIMEDTEN